MLTMLFPSNIHFVPKKHLPEIKIFKMAVFCTLSASSTVFHVSNIPAPRLYIDYSYFILYLICLPSH